MVFATTPKASLTAPPVEIAKIELREILISLIGSLSIEHNLLLAPNFLPGLRLRGRAESGRAG
mgnify:CR=1 FL=1